MANFRILDLRLLKLRGVGFTIFMPFFVGIQTTDKLHSF